MNIRLLVCDLDNTLYDWVGYFVPAFYAMVDEAVRITGCDREELLDDMREVHRRHHDAEHPFALLEAQIIQRHFEGKSRREIAELLDPAFHAFNVQRKMHLALYPGVRECLELISEAGIKVVAHTESKLYSVVDRLTRLKLTPFFRRIYCRERASTGHPKEEVGAEWLNRFPTGKVIELSHHQRKPDPNVLREICADEGTLPSDAAYVGDSIARDILMAREAGVVAIWAKYGSVPDPDFYRQLVRVTHWTDTDIRRESELKKLARGVTPDFVLETGFGQIAALLSNNRRTAARA